MADDDLSSYLQFRFVCKQADTLMALLDQLPNNGFEVESNDIFTVYVESSQADAGYTKQLEAIKEQIPFEFTTTEMKPENWNAVWEEDFEPVIVDDFCVVRADFHPSFGDKQYEIVITPQMSFGTGHHETTRGMIRMMRDIPFEGKKVLDFGCGTGILAILAAKLGAKHILGVDIDHNAYINSLHNCDQNDVSNVVIKKGALEETDAEYDIILANINRHVILDALPSLSDKLVPGNQLLLSGILHSDVPLLERHLAQASFKVVDTQQLEDWMCILTEKM